MYVTKMKCIQLFLVFYLCVCYCRRYPSQGFGEARGGEYAAAAQPAENQTRVGRDSVPADVSKPTQAAVRGAAQCCQPAESKGGASNLPPDH